MPMIIDNSIQILSRGGLGMAMFSLGSNFLLLLSVCFQQLDIKASKQRSFHSFYVSFNRFVHGITVQHHGRGCTHDCSGHGDEIYCWASTHGIILHCCWTQGEIVQSSSRSGASVNPYLDSNYSQETLRNFRRCNDKTIIP